MVMVQATLQSELVTAWSAPGHDTEAAAINAFVAAYTTFASAASSTSPITPAAVQLGDAAMRPPLVGMSADGAAPTAIFNSVKAFWTAVAIPSAFGANVAALAPPHAGLQAKLDAALGVFYTDVNLAAAAAATAMFSEATVGGTASYPPPPVGTPVPIL